jgi:hypothetical protein
MKRLATLALATVISVAILGRSASATPFSDVPANHWAYQYIQSLAADGIIDGLPDGKFNGNRPLTRYEMAAVVARAIAKIQDGEAGFASKADLDKLQKLIDALKDELDALGVRVKNVEDSLDALDKRTKFAQSLSMHGVMAPNVSFRQRTDIPQTITNGTGAAVITYWGTTAAAEGNGAATTVDPFVTAFLQTDDSNNVLTGAGSGIKIRDDARFTLNYAISDNLTVSFPVHILNDNYGGTYNQQDKFTIEPGVDVNIGSTGAFSNLLLRFGIIDNMKNSRTGLAFRAPYGEGNNLPYEQAFQPWQKGVSISGTLLGLTDFQASFTRVDQTLVNTQAQFVDPGGANGESQTYLFPVVPPQDGYVQTAGSGSLTSNSFNAGAGNLTQVYLTREAVLGTVYISQYNGTTFASNGQPIGAVQPGAPTAPPAFSYNSAYNAVVFSPPLGAGASVVVSYVGLNSTNNTNYQRYMINARINQKFKGYQGAEVGLTFNRIFDFDDPQTSGNVSAINQAPVNGNGAVSDTVFGVDFQAPIPYAISGKGSFPVLYGEAALSKYTPDFNNIAASTDSAGVIGARAKISGAEVSVQYQSVGPNYLDGAPFHYFGPAPPLFAFYKLPYFPDFYGIANSVGINQQFDGATGYNSSVNPNLTFAYPVFNPLKANGNTFYQAFTPNTQGVTANLTAPVAVGDITFKLRASYQHLSEITPNSLGNMLYGPAYASNVKLTYDTFTAGAGFDLPAFGSGQKLTVNLNGTYEKLNRPDETAFAYIPFNPATQTVDAGAANAAAAIGGSPVSFYPNYVNMKHYTYNSSVALPVAKNLGLNFSYTAQRYGGTYGTTLTQSISEQKNYYQGNLTYQIPKTNSSISVQSRNYTYKDDVLPSYNFVQNRQDINFNIRF